MSPAAAAGVVYDDDWFGPPWWTPEAVVLLHGIAESAQAVQEAPVEERGLDGEAPWRLAGAPHAPGGRDRRPGGAHAGRGAAPPPRASARDRVPARADVC